MNKKMSKRQRDIKSKLMAAICMLLVSSIMMVSTTYAWFTLSTAPEVTGITTAVGANGNLEMALLPKTGTTADINSTSGDGALAIEAKNVTWGNLVDLGDSTIYGLNKITLFPAALNAATADADGNPLTLAEAMLKTPTYGRDGRVSELVANTVTGYYDKTEENFAPNGEYGVRAVGTASGMTDRQLDYRNARSAANTAKAQAANQASQSLNRNGSALANIAIEYGMNSTNATFDATDVASLRAIVDDLNGTNGVLDRIETAYLQYILAYGASAASGTEDTAWSGVRGLVNAANATLDSVVAGLATYGVTLPDALQTAIAKYNAMVTAVETADTKLQAMEATLETNADATFTWAQIREAMAPLANPEAMRINGFLASEVKQNLGALVSSVTSQGGLKVIMATGAGVYADIADQSGDYFASITIESVEYNGIVLENMTARMETATTVNPVYLDAIGAVVVGAGAPGDGAAGSMPITDMFGYVIDLAFRTNAADSDLLLQVDAADRIYSDNSNEETMGHGSSMTFQATTPDFTNDQVKGLMSAIRIVFFDPTNGNKVVANAKLDAANAEQGANGLTAKMYMYKLEGTTTYTAATAEQLSNADVTLYAQSTDADGATTYTAADRASLVEGTTYYVATTGPATETVDPENVIMPLVQNQAHALSCLVYLDGNLVGNDDVAATASTSMTGSMNIQFASSATLVPMDYAALHIPSGNNTEGVVTGTTMTAVTANDGITAAGSFDTTGKVTINLTAPQGKTITGVTAVSVDGTPLETTAFTYADGKVTFTKTDIAAGTAVAITATLVEAT